MGGAQGFWGGGEWGLLGGNGVGLVGGLLDYTLVYHTGMWGGGRSRGGWGHCGRAPGGQRGGDPERRVIGVWWKRR